MSTSLKKSGEKYTIHLDENFNPCDFNAYVSKAYIRTLKDTFDIAKRIGANVINTHLSKGVNFTMPDRKIFLFEKYIDSYAGDLDIAKYLKQAEDLGARAVIETKTVEALRTSCEFIKNL